MPAIDDLLGASGVIEQLLLWNVVSQVISSMLSPAFTALQQDALKAHPDMVLTPDLLARAVTQRFMTLAEAEAEAARSGTDAARFAILRELATVRLSPADLAEAILRSYVDRSEAVTQAAQQGVDEHKLSILTLLAGDGIGPQQAAEALRRGIIEREGKGPDATSYEQAIVESRLHDKWGDTLYKLTQAILSPSLAADAVVRGFLPYDHAVKLAALSGVDEQQLVTLIRLAGDAPSPTELAVALRRGVIPEDSGNPDVPGFVQGIRQGRLADKWIPMIHALAQEWPTPADALEARLVGQVTDDESRTLYERFGGDPAYWRLLLDTRGEAPTPLELNQMLNRGFIEQHGLGTDKTTYEQGFHEGRWRNKWLPAYEKFRHYQPPEGTIVLFLSHGVIGDEEAADLLGKLGMDADTIRLYLSEAHLEAYSDYRGATVQMVLEAYYEQLITAEQALSLLEGFHVTHVAATLMLDFQDARRAFTAVNNALSRTRTLYAARKITLQTARNSLIELGIQPGQVEGIIKSWQIENSISVKPLTEAQIADAVAAQLITETEGMIELENIGYTPFDSWVILSLKLKKPLPGKPVRGPAPPQGQVIPGTT